MANRTRQHAAPAQVRVGIEALMSEALLISRRERKKLTTKAQLLDAARRLFAEKTVAKTTIDEITEAADVSRATFFNYFQSKNAILQELWVEQISSFSASVDRHIGIKVSTFERLRNMFREFVREALKQPDYFKAVTAELELDWSTPEVSKVRVDRFHDALERLVATGISQGDIGTDHKIRFIAQMIGAVYISILREWRLDPDYDLSARFDEAARFLANAIRPTGSKAL
jgi:AcrR family transcriptional regulator